MMTKVLELKQRPADALSAYQSPNQDALSKQLADVAQRSDFYRRHLGLSQHTNALTSDDLTSLPFTTRAELQHDQETHPPFGSYLAAPSDQIARVHKTSGSSGRALLIALSRPDIEHSVAVGSECFRAAGAQPGDLIVHCLNYCMWSGGLTDHEALERSGAGVIPYGVGKSSELIEMIRTIRPTGIHCTPSYLAMLEARLMSDFNMVPRDLGLRIGLFGGESGVQDPAFRGRIEQTWGLRAMDANYGMSEVLSMFGAECEARDGLHFFASNVLHAELKSLTGDDTSPLEKGATGELVLTHLHRQCQPLIRYRTSDIIEIIETDRCSCGRSSPRFRVVGRVDDMMVIRGINVFPARIAAVINRFPDQLTGEYRVHVSRKTPIREFRVLVERNHAIAAEPLVEDVADALEKELTVRPIVEMVPPGRFTRTSGKTCRIERIL